MIQDGSCSEDSTIVIGGSCLLLTVYWQIWHSVARFVKVHVKRCRLRMERRDKRRYLIIYSRNQSLLSLLNPLRNYLRTLHSSGWCLKRTFLMWYRVEIVASIINLFYCYKVRWKRESLTRLALYLPLHLLEVTQASTFLQMLRFWTIYGHCGCQKSVSRWT